MYGFRKVKQRMIDELWLHFPLWQGQLPDRRLFIVDNFFIREMLADLSRLKAPPTVGLFFFHAIEDPEAEIRESLWKFIRALAVFEFSEGDQDALFAITVVEANVEVLKHASWLLWNRVGGFHTVVQRWDFFSAPLTLFHSPSEEVRILGLNMLWTIHALQLSQNLPEAALPFATYVLRAVKMYNPANATTAFWDTLLDLFRGGAVQATVFFPAVAVLSRWANERGILCALSAAATSVEAIVQCPVWYFWLFYLANQAAGPELRLCECPCADLFASCCRVLAQSDHPGDFAEVFAFFRLMELGKRWDLAPLVRAILLQVLWDVSPTDRTLNSVGSEAVLFLWFLFTSGAAARNRELDARHGIPGRPPLAESVPTTADVEVLSSCFIREDSGPTCVFSPRFSPSGEWLDIELGMTLARWLLRPRPKPGMVPLYNAKLRPADIAGSLLGLAVRSDFSRLEACATIAESLPDAASFALFFIQLAYASLDGREAQFQQFVTAHEAQVQSVTKRAVTEPDEVLSFFGDEIAAFHEALFDEVGRIAADVKVRNEALIHRLFDRVQLLAVAGLSESIVRVAAQARAQQRAVMGRHRAFGAKQYRRLCRELATDPRALASSDHLKLWQIYDWQFRRVFLKRNTRFTIHKDASLLRDEPDAAVAAQKYRVFLHTHLNEQEAESEESEQRHIDHNFATEARLVTLEKTYSGTFFMSKREICFSDSDSKSVVFAAADLEMVLWRSVVHIDSGLEFFLNNGRSHFLFFPNGDRDRVLRRIRRWRSRNLRLLQLEHARAYVAPFTEKWRNGELSNYSYLLILNFLAGRSFNDLAQYPVLPWVIADYKSDQLDFEQPSTFRDLTKPIGALNEARLQSLLNLFECLDDDMPDRCLYRMHYSTAGYIVSWLIRMEPFTGFHISLQGGRFDHADRLFWSIPRTWESVTSIRPDFRELIPEFFSTPSFLVNANEFDLGQPEGERGDVVLPPWAHGSPHAFIAWQMRALESQYVSSSLHHWIDLIFGVNQSGRGAIEANNVFHPHCYEFSASHPRPTDPEELAIVEAHAGNFGVVPHQIFTAPHPARTPRAGSPPRARGNMKLPIAINDMFAHRGGIVAVGRDGTVAFLPARPGALAPVTELQTIGRLPPGHDYITFLPETGSGSRLVTGGSDGIRVFSLEAAGLLSQAAFRERLAAVTALVPAGDALVFAAWGNAGLTMWSLTGGEQTRVWRRAPHGSPVVAIAASAPLRTVASVDKARRCILSTLDGGKVVRAFAVDGTDPILRLLLAPGGFIAVAGATFIKLYDLSAVKVAEIELGEAITSWTVGESYCGNVCLAVAKEFGLTLLRIPELTIFAEIAIERRIAIVLFASHLKLFLVGTREGEVIRVNID
jgi:hypothetical protein